MAIGLLYALVCVGFVVILSTAKIFNFAHGEFYMLGAYLLYTLNVSLHLNFLLSVFVSALSIGLMGALLGRFIFMRIRPAAGQPLGESLLKSAAVTIALGLMFKQFVLHFFGTAARGVNPVFQGVISIGGATLNIERIAVLIYALVLIVLLWWFLTRTRLGLAVRATGVDEISAKLQGINTGRMFVVSVGAGTALAAAAGAIIAPVLAVNQEMGGQMLFLSFLALLLGGMQSAIGAGIGGLLVGLGLSFGFYFLGALGELAFFVLLAIFIIFKPTGILGGRFEV
jgi:branched-chain amino acid transport system permease protein